MDIRLTGLEISIFVGVFNLDASVGVYAPDAESYKTFAPLFDKIIQDYHGFSSSDMQPPVDLGEGKSSDFPPLDPKGKYIKSTRYLFFSLFFSLQLLLKNYCFFSTNGTDTDSININFLSF